MCRGRLGPADSGRRPVTAFCDHNNDPLDAKSGKNLLTNTVSAYHPDSMHVGSSKQPRNFLFLGPRLSCRYSNSYTVSPCSSSSLAHQNHANFLQNSFVTPTRCARQFGAYSSSLFSGKVSLKPFTIYTWRISHYTGFGMHAVRGSRRTAISCHPHQRDMHVNL